MVSFIANQNNESGYNILLSNFSMALSLGLVNAREYSIAFKTASRLSRQLRREVEQQTESSVCKKNAWRNRRSSY